MLSLCSSGLMKSREPMEEEETYVLISCICQRRTTGSIGVF
jgi:hypothetical protein